MKSDLNFTFLTANAALVQDQCILTSSTQTEVKGLKSFMNDMTSAHGKVEEKLTHEVRTISISIDSKLRTHQEKVFRELSHIHDRIVDMPDINSDELVTKQELS